MLPAPLWALRYSITGARANGIQGFSIGINDP